MNGKAGDALDLVAAGLVGAYWLEWLPYLATGLTVVWLLMRIYDWIRAKLKKE